MPQPQDVEAPLTLSATFLTLTVDKKPGSVDKVRSALASVSDLTKNVFIRAPASQFAVTVGIGSEVWDELTHLPRPKELHPFKEQRGAKHVAPSTPGDVLLHIRADRRDVCYEFERQLLAALDGAVTVVDEVVGFRYFDARDLLGFVDGTANPVGQDLNESVMITASDDPAAAGGSYLVTQKYLHDLKGWNALKVETQEGIIGRTKLDNVELPDQGEEQQKPHKQLNTIDDEHGVERDILRDNMPFGSPSGESGTFFIGYSRELWVTEKMLERMFIGVPEGLYDKILDYSTAKTGNVFFVPSADVLAGLDG